jgi:glycerate dehydrogenase
MQIIVLDGYTLNPGDLSWAPLEAIGPTVIYDRTPPELVVERAAAAAIVLTNKTVISREHIRQLPQLKYIGVMATGHNIVDVEAAKERGIPVTNVPTYSTLSVAQLALAHLLNLTLHVGQHAASVAAGKWSRSIDFCYWEYPLIELAGLTMGIVGFGRIGRATARLAQAMEMRVVASDPAPPSQLPDGVKLVELDELFSQSDVVSLHCPLTPQTERLVNRARLALMKPTAFLINTSRGGLIDEPALAEALRSGGLAGAGLDVLSVEPPPHDHPLLTAPNCYITPHIAWATAAARKRLLAAVVENVQAFLAGRPQNVVNA